MQDLEMFEDSSLSIVNIVARTFHMDFYLKEGIAYSVFMIVSLPELLESIE